MLAYWLNPLIVPPVALGLLGVHTGADQASMIWIVSMATTIYIVLPGVMLYLLRRAGRIQSFEIRNRSSRITPMMGGVAFSLSAIPLVSTHAGASSQLVTLVATCLFIASLMAALLTLRQKLSLHSASFSGLFVIVTWLFLFVPPATGAWFFVDPGLTVVSLLLIPVVAWSRLRTSAHTPAEVVTGIVFGLVTITVSLYILGPVWPQ